MQKIELDGLWRSSIERLPYTLAAPLQRFVASMEAESYGNAVRDAVDFFEIATQYLSCLLLVFLQDQGVAPSAESAAAPPAAASSTSRATSTAASARLGDAVRRIDAKRNLSFGDLVNDIFKPLLEASKGVNDVEWLTKLGEYLGVNNRVNNPYYKCNEFPSEIVTIRNRVIAHESRLAEEIYRTTIEDDKLVQRIYLMLQALAPLQEWTFLSCVKQLAPNQYAVNRLNGGRVVSDILTTDRSLEEYHYYAFQGDPAESAVAVIDLFPLVFCNENNFVYVFQTLTYAEKVQYISSNEYALRIAIDKWNSAFDQRMKRTYSSFDITRELNRLEIQAFAHEASRRFIMAKRFDKGLYVDRAVLSQSFQSFRASCKLLFPMIGEAGQGKTYQLCHWTDELMATEDAMVLTFSCADFSKHTLVERLQSVFDFSSRKSVAEKLKGLHRTLKQEKVTLYLFFDALNECLTYKGAQPDDSGPAALYRDIFDMLIKEEFTQFKVIISCRSYTWMNSVHPGISDHSLMFYANEEDKVIVRGFSDAELEQVYEKYRVPYQISMPFAEIPKEIKIRLRDPLVFKAVCIGYMQNWPAELAQYTSVALFDKMLTTITSIGYGTYGTDKAQILREFALYVLRMYENGAFVDGISLSRLREAYREEDSPLHNIAHLIYEVDSRGEFSERIVYRDLINDDRNPVIWFVQSNEEGQLKFVYERFLEFLMASVFSERELHEISDANNVIPAKRYVDVIRQSNTNEVFIGTIRNVLLMDYVRTADPSVIIELISEYSRGGAASAQQNASSSGEEYKTILSSLISETLDVLIRENYEAELFTLIEHLLSKQPEAGAALIRRYNEVYKKVEASQADNEVIGEYIRLSNQMAPIIRLREQAAISIVNGIFLSDFFNEGLYQRDPYRLLWMMLTDPILDVRDDTIMYVYYLSKKTHTIEHTLLKENLTQNIIRSMFAIIKKTSATKFLVGLISDLAFKTKLQEQTLIFLETGGRLSLLLIIDMLMSNAEKHREQINLIFTEMKAVFSHVTFDYAILKLLVRLAELVLRRQASTLYVNNFIEYQTFWDKELIPLKSDEEDAWSREVFREMLRFFFCYLRRNEEASGAELQSFENYQKKVLAAYKLGDSFSYFVLERILVVIGTCDWNLVSPIVNAFFSGAYRDTEYYDYSQMSMLYILYQIAIYNPEADEEIVRIFSRESEDWTRRCKGFFKGRNSHIANPTKLYKRSVMTWYCVIYCNKLGDNLVRSGDERPVSVFYKLLDEAIAQKDKELLYHLIESIMELVSDPGLIKTALSLTKYLMQQFDTQMKIDIFDDIASDRGGLYQEGLVAVIGKVLSTAKNHFDADVNNFLKDDIASVSFPDVDKYKSELLNYHPSGERLSDLLTHKFGNFLMWSLLHEEAIDRVVCEVLSLAADATDCFSWFKQAARIIASELLDQKI